MYFVHVCRLARFMREQQGAEARYQLSQNARRRNMRLFVGNINPAFGMLLSQPRGRIALSVFPIRY